MANAMETARTCCVLRVGIKCCRGCQTKAKRKLLSVSGVTAVEYNAEQGLLTVSGDANPETLLLKLTQWGKKAELLHISASVPHNHTAKTEEKKRPPKCWLLRCFGMPSSKVKVQPCRGPWVENATPLSPSMLTPLSPPMLYPPPPFPPPPPRAIPYPPPCFGPSQPPPYAAGMFRPPPPQSPPYFHTQFPHMVNSRLLYPHSR